MYLWNSVYTCSECKHVCNWLLTKEKSESTRKSVGGKPKLSKTKEVESSILESESEVEIELQDEFDDSVESASTTHNIAFKPGEWYVIVHQK